VRWYVSVECAAVSEDDVYSPCSGWDGCYAYPHGFYWADWIFVGVLAIYVDVSVGWECADFRVVHIIDSGSLGGGRLLGLAKLGIGLGFGRTFFVLLEEGRFYSTGF